MQKSRVLKGAESGRVRDGDKQINEERRYAYADVIVSHDATTSRL